MICNFLVLQCLFYLLIPCYHVNSLSSVMLQITQKIPGPAQHSTRYMRKIEERNRLHSSCNTVHPIWQEMWQQHQRCRDSMSQFRCYEWHVCPKRGWGAADQVKSTLLFLILQYMPKAAAVWIILHQTRMQLSYHMTFQFVWCFVRWWSLFETTTSCHERDAAC